MDILKESMRVLRLDREKIKNRMKEATRISLKWVTLENTISPVKDMSIACKLDQMKEYMMVGM